MNKLLIGIIVVVVIGLAALSWILLRPNGPQPQEPQPPTAPTQPTTPAEPPTSNNPTQTQTDQVSVDIKDFAFAPQTITVKKGTKVTWTNQDSTAHNVVSDSSSPAGGPPPTADLVPQGQSFSFTFNTVGTFTYHCAPHPNMKGTVQVVD